MHYVILLLPVVLSRLVPPLPDLGVETWECDPSIMAKSKVVPTSVHSVRFADIKVVAALGDSLTAGNGAKARLLLGLFKEDRGVAFQIGGDLSLEEHITIPNVLRKFNPNLIGYSTGSGKWDSWQVSKFNMAVPGSQSKELHIQAKRLVDRMRQHPEVDIANDWKLVNIFIGGNDICKYCNDKNANIDSPHGGNTFKENLIRGIKVLKENLPSFSPITLFPHYTDGFRTIVSVTGILNVELLRPVAKLHLFCQGLQYLYECNCEYYPKETNEVCNAYREAQLSIQHEGLFDSSDDFTYVVQPFTFDVEQPPITKDGKADGRFFAPDCFHFSQLGHSNMAKHLWNNIIEPVGAKSTSANFTNLDAPLLCPNKACPLFPTTKNSKNCTAYLKPSVLE